MRVVHRNVIYIGVAILFCLVGYWVYLNWFDLILISQQWQRYFHQQLTSLLINIKTNPIQTGVTLIIVSFIYGLLHAAGPGHGKMIITTYLATQPNKFKKSLFITLISAIMQGIVAICLVSVILVIFNLSAKQLKQSEYWLELVSYILIVMLGVMLCYKALKKIIYLSATKIVPKKIRFKKVYSIRPFDDKIKLEPHHHDHACCNHKHLPTANEIARSKTWYHDLAIVLAIGIRPCSGALLVLMFSYIVGVYYWGVFATIAMSFGTALTTSMFALLVYCARKLAQHLISTRTVQSLRLFSLLSYGLALLGGIVFVVIGLVLIMAIKQQAIMVNPVLG